MVNRLTNTIAVIGLVLGTNSIAQAQTAPSPVRVQVYGTHEGPNIVYHYTVINNGTVPLHHFVIGTAVDADNPDGYPQLDRRPAGWSYGGETETGTEILLSPTSTSQPPYWQASLCGKQEFSFHCLEWSVTPDGQPYAIPPGQSLAGFSVAVALIDNRQFPHAYQKAGVVTGLPSSKYDDTYLTSGFMTSYWDVSANAVKELRGKLEIADHTPPTLSVTLTPSTLWPPNEKMATITATIRATDDLDPNPVVRLLSITANEPLDKDDVRAQLYADTRQFQLKAERNGSNKTGRVYTVTYYAADASGNQTETSAAVTVPHDERENETHEKEGKKGR